MARMERCPACRARLAEAEVCTRCGTDFSVSRRAERQAQELARIAVRQLFLGQTTQAAATADAATHLASPLLALAVLKTIGRRRSAVHSAGVEDPPQGF
jgi:hypothetical protein